MSDKGLVQSGKVGDQYGIALLFAARDDETFAIWRPSEVEYAVGKIK